MTSGRSSSGPPLDRLNHLDLVGNVGGQLPGINREALSRGFGKLRESLGIAARRAVADHGEPKRIRQRTAGWNQGSCSRVMRARFVMAGGDLEERFGKIPGRRQGTSR